MAIAVEGATAEAGPYLMHNEPIWRDGQIVGHVTSGGWGFRMGAMVGLASLHRDAGVSKAWIEEGGFTAQIAGVHYKIRAQLGPFYDPDGRIMRG